MSLHGQQPEEMFLRRIEESPLDYRPLCAYAESLIMRRQHRRAEDTLRRATLILEGELATIMTDVGEQDRRLERLARGLGMNDEGGARRAMTEDEMREEGSHPDDARADLMYVLFAATVEHDCPILDVYSSRSAPTMDAILWMLFR